MRPSGVLTSLVERSLGDHVCWPYDTAGDLARAATGYLSDGIAAGERVVYIGAPDGHRAALEGVSRAGHDGGALLEMGTLVLGSTEGTYVGEGIFDPDARLAEYGAMAEQAVAEGYTGLRVLGDVSALLSRPDVRRSWASYELRADLLTAREPMLAVCAYDTRECDRDTLALMRAVHALRDEDDTSPGPGYHIHADGEGGLALAGEIDMTVADGIGRLLLPCARDLSRPSLDLSRLRFVDVAGVRMIASFARRLHDRFGAATIIGASPTFRTIWRILSLDRRVGVTLEEDR